MTYFPLTQAQQDWQRRIADIADREVAPHADAVDKHRQFPQASLQALQRDRHHLYYRGRNCQTLPVDGHVLQDAPGSL
jgi:hypothetical protein